ncbi:hypothetical protein [Shinella sp. BYT-45]|uniref:hypothetical protein n=1 Tax=Shinella sp. BYT-45 TaxID=3377377 RepID=UPI00397F19F7
MANLTMKKLIGFVISGMQQVHIIHAHIALHKIRKRSYSSDIGSEMIQAGDRGAA